MKIVLVSLQLFLSVVCFAQSKKVPGYYISAQGDTVRGMITEYREWNINPDRVSFLTNDSKSIVLTPVNSLGFGADGLDSYISYQGSRMTNPVELRDMVGTGEVPPDHYDSLTTFLRRIGSSGQTGFYIYKDRVRHNLYYSIDGAQPVELLQKVYVMGDALRESGTYKVQLQNLFENHPQRKKLVYVTYTEESLSGFLNKAEGRVIARPAGNGFMVLAGASFSSFNYTGISNGANQSYSSHVGPVAGLAYILSINRNFGRAFLMPLLDIYTFKTSSVETVGAFTHTSKFEPSFLASLTFHVGYNLVHSNNLKLFLAPGVGALYLNGNKHVFTNASSTASTTETSTMPDLTAILKLQAGAILKNKFLVWASYQPPVSITDYAGSQGKLQTIQLGLGIKF